MDKVTRIYNKMGSIFNMSTLLSYVVNPKENNALAISRIEQNIHLAIDKFNNNVIKVDIDNNDQYDIVIALMAIILSTKHNKKVLKPVYNTTDIEHINIMLLNYLKKLTNESNIV